MSVTWVQDGNGNYEVSSREHLKQLMNNGSLYTDAGSSPSSYWAAGTNYIQTADIDLLSSSTDINPIGGTSGFYGDYDGGGFSISNWSYLDSNYTSTTNCQLYVGLFGYSRENVLKNIRLTGVFSLLGFHAYCGFLVGYSQETNVFNIVCDFDSGTNMTRGDASTVATSLRVGCVAGYVRALSSVSAFYTGIEVKGDIELVLNGSITFSYIGGICGYTDDTEISLVSISATISGLSGYDCGGIVGLFRDSHLSKSMNNMTGDITAIKYAGGIVGTVTNTHSITDVVNSMTGNIINVATNSTSGAGGITGEAEAGGTYGTLFNYMKGNITGFNSAGMFARVLSSTSVTNSINAMDGNADNSVLSTTGSSGTLTGDVVVITNYGLNYSTNDNGTSTPLTGFSTLSAYPDLPYVTLGGSDAIGTSYSYDFVFANVGAVAIAFPPLIATPRATNIPVSFDAVTGAIGYNVTIEGPVGGEITVLSGVTELEHNITGLDPETEYTVKLYANTGAGYSLEEQLVTTTLANVAASYDVTDFQDENGVTDLASLDTTTLSNITSVITELVNTGDLVSVSIGGSNLETTFVDSAGVVNLASVDGILLPFEASSGAGQSVTLTLADTTTTSITYDEANNAIAVESGTYTAGDTFILDGNKMEVFGYYGLTVVSVSIAPLIVEPSVITIPITITEVPGAIGYRVSYTGPYGVEKTSFTDVTTLEHNITGLDPETTYDIKLYADTGTGYELTEEVTANTLANIAANYDMASLTQDGVINLSSLPENTISNINEVIDELFNTGDIVSVSVSDKTTSFINLGDTLSIKEVNGVLLPFLPTSGSGQDVSVILSDDTTTVSINYDDAVNTITVEGVVYYPGDSFILDGKKITVIEY